MKLSHPTSIEMTLRQTLFHRSEPIPVRVRIPPPSSNLIAEKGLRLQSVAVSLLRKITATSYPPITTTTVTTRSGKSCRFSPTRPLSLLLVLPPRLEDDDACETVTQSTIFHEVRFSVRLTIVLTSSNPGDRTELYMEREVGILPDVPVTKYPGRKAEKQREAAMENAYWQSRGIETTMSGLDLEGQAPTYGESEGSSSATQQILPLTWLEADEEEEYDGYEETASAEADQPPPPSISEDVAPPALSPSHLDHSQYPLGSLLNGTSLADPPSPPIFAQMVYLAPNEDYHSPETSSDSGTATPQSTPDDNALNRHIADDEAPPSYASGAQLHLSTVPTNLGIWPPIVRAVPSFGATAGPPPYS